MENIWINILSSAVIASIISAIVGYVFNVLMQKRKYKDDYYKMVIGKRMEAYAKVEEVYKLLKTYASEDFGQSGHCIIFNDKEMLRLCFKKLYKALNDNIWLSRELDDDLQYLNDMLMLFKEELENSDGDIKELGKLKNPIFAEIRTFIDKHYKEDMLTLYDVKGFLKSKNK